MQSRLFPSFVLAAVLAAFLLCAARAADDSVNTIKFSDPAKPGTVKVILGHGSLRLTGSATAPEVTVKSIAKPVTKTVRKDGLRVLTAASSFGLVERDNVVTLDAVSESFKGGGGAEFTLTVPRNTRVIVQSAWGSDINCSDLSGDLEIKNTNGEVRLDGIRGGVLVETINGEIRANIAELHEGKPLSFTSMNGEVVLRVPSEAKADVRFRTQNGSVLTDFEETALVTKTENTPRTSTTWARRGPIGPRAVKPSPPSPPTPAVAPTAPTTPTASASPVPASAPVADSDATLDPETRAEIRAGIRAGAQAVRDAVAIARDAAQAAHDGLSDSGFNLNLNLKMPTIPNISGGKLVSGALNGGGPEISITTMNGDITLRQLEKTEKK